MENSEGEKLLSPPTVTGSVSQNVLGMLFFVDRKVSEGFVWLSCGLPRAFSMLI